jgi:hypothetical protein
MKASKLNSRVLCVLVNVHLISVMKYTWHWGNYHWSISWDNQLGLWTLILLGKCPSPSTVSVSTLFFWKQFRVLSEGCHSLVFGNVDKVYFLWGSDWNLNISVLMVTQHQVWYKHTHHHICKNYIHCIKQWRYRFFLVRYFWVTLLMLCKWLKLSKEFLQMWYICFYQSRCWLISRLKKTCSLDNQ